MFTRRMKAINTQKGTLDGDDEDDVMAQVRGRAIRTNDGRLVETPLA